MLLLIITISHAANVSVGLDQHGCLYSKYSQQSMEYPTEEQSEAESRYCYSLPRYLIHCHTQSYSRGNHAVNDGLTDFDSKYQ